MSLKYKD